MRPYQIADKPACMAIFNSNRPKFFTTEEIPEFSKFLDGPSCDYFVMETDTNDIISCGGHYTNAERTRGGLAWGMVHQDYHGQGLGKKLTLFRLFKLSEEAPTAILRLDTSHHTESFYAKFGFVTEKVTPDGYGIGLHRHDMTLQLNPQVGELLRQAYSDIP